MTKTQLIAAVAEKSNLTRAEATRAVNALLATVSEGLSRGERVALPGFGTFRVTEVASRIGRNPRTGTRIQLAAGRRARFRPSKGLKDVL